MVTTAIGQEKAATAILQSGGPFGGQNQGNAASCLQQETEADVLQLSTAGGRGLHLAGIYKRLVVY